MPNARNRVWDKFSVLTDAQGTAQVLTKKERRTDDLDLTLRQIDSLSLTLVHRDIIRTVDQRRFCRTAD